MSNQSDLAYDAEAVSLVGNFCDEVSAYRARRSWMEVFNNFFLLERDRDYDMVVDYDAGTSTFVLDCTFSSACGRYAFWRLINHQAPEAEQILCSTVGEGEVSEQKGFFSSLLASAGEAEPSWIIQSDNYSGIERSEDYSNRDNLLNSFFGSINRFFQ